VSPGQAVLFGPPITTRAQAIAEGVLIDVTDTAVQAGFAIPVAMTCSAWEDVVAWTEEDSRRQVPQQEARRLWNVLWVLRCRSLAKRDASTRELWFEVCRVPRDRKCRLPKAAALKALIHPGDGGEAVITVMRPGEE
jgi:hypothetical protein